MPVMRIVTAAAAEVTSPSFAVNEKVTVSVWPGFSASWRPLRIVAPASVRLQGHARNLADQRVSQRIVLNIAANERAGDDGILIRGFLCRICHRRVVHAGDRELHLGCCRQSFGVGDRVSKGFQCRTTEAPGFRSARSDRN